MAEQLLGDGSINEIVIKRVNLKKARMEIGISLLRYSGTNLYPAYS